MIAMQGRISEDVRGDVGVGISLENARNPQLLLRHLITYFNYFYSFGGQQNFLLT